MGEFSNQRDFLYGVSCIFEVICSEFIEIFIMSEQPDPFGQKKMNPWGSPDSWGKSIPQITEQIRQQKIQARQEQKKLINSWGNPSTWSNQYSSKINQSQKSKNSWGNPFGWPQTLGNQKSSQITPEKAKIEPGFTTSSQGQNGWGTYQYQGWSVPQVNSAQNVQYSNISGWGSFKGSCNSNEGATLKGDQFFEFLKQKGIDDEVICILATEGINSMEILRMCTQQALAVKGIKLSEVVKLKSL